MIEIANIDVIVDQVTEKVIKELCRKSRARNKYSKVELMNSAINFAHWCSANNVEAEDFTKRLWHIYSQLECLNGNIKVFNKSSSEKMEEK